MPTDFPTALDAFVNPSPGSSLRGTNVSHHLQHANNNDAIEALQAKVGANNATVITSLDFGLFNASSLDIGHAHSASLLKGLPLPLNIGGTGATNTSDALANLTAANVTHAHFQGVPASIASTNASGASTLLVALADHVHQGVHSLAKSGDPALFKDVTLSEGGGITLLQSGNNIQITAGGSGAWARLVSVTSTASAVSFSSGIFAARNSIRIIGLMIFSDPISTSNEDPSMQFNNDISRAYSSKISAEAGVPSTAANTSLIKVGVAGNFQSADRIFFDLTFSNFSSQPKLGTGVGVMSFGTGASTIRLTQHAMAWGPASQQITEVNFLFTHNAPATNFIAGTNITVYGSD